MADRNNIMKMVGPKGLEGDVAKFVKSSRSVYDNHADTDLKRQNFLSIIETRLTGYALSQIQHHTFNNFNDFINQIQSL